MSSVTRPLRKDAERNRLRILESAAELFAERGLHASLDDIAHHAGVGVGTVYRRFPDKEALIDALFEQRIEEIVAIARDARGHDDPWEGLVHFFEQTMRLQSADRGLKEILLSTDRGRERVCVARDQIGPIVADLLAEAQAAGAVRPDIERVDVQVINMMLGSVADAARTIEPALWRRYLTIVLDGLRAQPMARTELPVAALTDEQMDRAMQSFHPPARVKP